MIETDIAEGPSRPIHIDAGSLSSPKITGIGRYTARLALALARRGEVRFFDSDTAVIPPRSLSWDEDQDLSVWARRVWRGRRARLDPSPDSVGIHTCLRPAGRRFATEVSVLHDLTPLIMPWSHVAGTIADFREFYARRVHGSDLALADSHSTKADAAWLCDFPASKIAVAHPGPSLCVHRHLDETPVERRDNVGLVVATREPRKNGEFLIDWFGRSEAVSPGTELWWVGARGWKISKGLARDVRFKDGRRIRFLGFVDDHELCRLHRSAGWMIYPSLYEGFGFPVLDALRHGTRVLTSGNSSLREFAGPGVGFFDPLDPKSLDSAFAGLREGRIDFPEPLERMNRRFSWDRLIDVLADHLEREPGRTEANLESRAA